MSTLAAAKADNMYYPPGWDPSKGSLNKFHGSHGALGKRANKLHEGILVIRFEMPFNVWCVGCGHLIGKGVRFNAEKRQIGMYHSTRVWGFTMKTPCCQSKIEVHTDPKNAEYVIVSGARRKVEAFDAEAAGTVELDPEARAARTADPFSKLEYADDDRTRAQRTHREIAALREDAEAKHRDDYAMNKQLRRQMRAARKEEKAADDHRQRLGLPEHVKLLPESKTDVLVASGVQFGAQKFQQNWKHARRSIASGSIFSPAAVAAARGARAGGGAAGKAAGAKRPAGGQLAAGQQSSKQRRLDAAVKLKLSDPAARSKG